MLHAVGLKVDFAGVSALDVAELRLRDRRITVVLGPNGSGKTCLLRALAGLVGKATVELDRDGRRRPLSPVDVAFAFQKPVLLRGSVRHNLELALSLRAIAPEDRRRRLDEVIDALDLAGLLGRPSRALSGGEAQRVNLARALALGGAVTLLDEPLAGLDGEARARMVARLPELLRPATERGVVVLVTHSLHEAQRLADDLLLLVAGRVRALGAASEVMAAPEDEECARLLGFTVHRTATATFAVPPGGWRLDGDEAPATLTVTRLLELPGQRRVLGTVAGAAVEIALSPRAPSPRAGDELAVRTAEGARVVFSECC